MGRGVQGPRRPPANAEHPPYIETYQAAGGWQTQCIFWAGTHWDCWDTGGGPYGFEAEARADATEWANGWHIELRLPDTPPDPRRAPGLLDNVKVLAMASSGRLALKCADGEHRVPPSRRDGESAGHYRDRLLTWCTEGFLQDGLS